MIDFFQVKDSHNVIGKVRGRQPLFSLDVPLLKKTEPYKIKLVVYSQQNLKLANYCYIPDFDRYYFIEKTTITRVNLYELHLRVDVLESHGLKILNSKDVEYFNNVNVVQSHVDSINTQDREVSYILSTIGG